MIFFGLCANLVPVAGNYSGLMALRFFLGCGEGVAVMGFLYLSLWYKADELALRTGTLQYCVEKALLTFDAQLSCIGQHL